MNSELHTQCHPRENTYIPHIHTYIANVEKCLFLPFFFSYVHQHNFDALLEKYIFKLALCMHNALYAITSYTYTENYIAYVCLRLRYFSPRHNVHLHTYVFCIYIETSTTHKMHVSLSM